jgi:hypothetical protein
MLVLNCWDQLFAFNSGAFKLDFGFYVVNLEAIFYIKANIKLYIYSVLMSHYSSHYVSPWDGTDCVLELKLHFIFIQEIYD